MIMRILIVYLVNFVQDFTNFTEIQFLWADDSDIHSIIHTIHDDHSGTICSHSNRDDVYTYYPWFKQPLAGEAGPGELEQGFPYKLLYF